jgi:cytoskeleton protein RodZ
LSGTSHKNVGTLSAILASVTPGHELRSARERLSLSREQISSRTKIQVRKIAALEEQWFDQLPAGIYLDGIAAAYAREVGLDAEAIVRRLRTHVAPPPPATLEDIAAARQAAEDRRRGAGPGGLSVAHSMAAFAAVAIVLAIAGVGVQLYPGLIPTAVQETTVSVTPADPEPAATTAVDSRLRSERGTTGVIPDLEPTRPLPGEVSISAEAQATTPVTVVRRAEGTDGVERRPLAQERTAPATAEQKDTVIQSVAAAVGPTAPARVPQPPSLTGVWTLETRVESSSFKAFEGLRLGYRLALRQDGDRIVGTGLKVAENGMALKPARRTAITVHGTLDDGRVRLTFGEQGARRRTSGTLNLVLDETGVLRGGFASEAARSAGAAKARRL